MRGDGTVFRQKGSRFLWIQYYVGGEPKRESTKIDPAEVGEEKAEKLARKKLRQRVAEVATGEICTGGRIKLSQLHNALERDYAINHRKDIGMVQSRWRNHLEPFFGNKNVSQVNAETISQYIAHRQSQLIDDEPPSNATINRELAHLKRMYKLAVETGQLKLGQQPYIAMLKERNVRKGFLKDEEYQALARETAKIGLWLRAMFEVAYTYGWRRGELIGPHGLRVNQIDIGSRQILLNPGETKNDQGRAAPMTDKVLELMVACIDGKKSVDYVFTREKDLLGRHPKTPYIVDFREYWYEACVNAGVGKFKCREHDLELEDGNCPACGKLPEEKRVYEGLFLHDLRRTGARNMRRLGIHEKTIMNIGGWKTRSVFDRYNIVDPRDLAEAGAKLNQAARTRDAEVTLPAHVQPSLPLTQKPN